MYFFLDIISSYLGTVLTPVVLFLSAAVMYRESGIKDVLKPGRFLRCLTDKNNETTVTPFKALSVALAGTLGVGNITGVASALIAGGPGAVFWMWVGAFAVISVKYSEVVLAVKYREKKEKSYIGGAFYYISKGLSVRFGKKFSGCAASAFAVLCCLNSLITGNIVQSNTAASVISAENRTAAGIILMFAVLLSITFFGRKIEQITSRILPSLTLAYIIFSLIFIIGNRVYLPGILKDIFVSAFSLRSAAGGAIGFTMREAFRFGIMRGIFSNEAGCGTSPTAHASADTRSPAHQGCLGIVEVIFDTHILCTLSAVVFLIADRRLGILSSGVETDAAMIVLFSFEKLGGRFSLLFIRTALILFAYSTIIAQYYYGSVAAGFLNSGKKPQIIFSVLTASASALGAVIQAPYVWQLADIIIGIMTVVNCVAVILLRKEVRRSGRVLW